MQGSRVVVHENRPMILLEVITGGQDGVDLGALRAAKGTGFRTGGWMPKGYLCEAGRFHGALRAVEYGLKECPREGYPARTQSCCAMSNALLWMGDHNSPGGKLSLRLAKEKPIPDILLVREGMRPSSVVKWLEMILEGEEGWFSLWIAGNRKSRHPQIEEQTERFLTSVFTLLRKTGNFQ